MNGISDRMMAEQERAGDERSALRRNHAEISKRLMEIEQREMSSTKGMPLGATPNQALQDSPNAASSMSWRYYIEQRMEFYMRRLAELEALKLALPTRMAPRAEEAMLSLLTEGKW